MKHCQVVSYCKPQFFLQFFRFLYFVFVFLHSCFLFCFFSFRCYSCLNLSCERNFKSNQFNDNFSVVIASALINSLCKKSPNMEFFLFRIYSYSEWIRENTDQKKLRIWTLFTQWLELYRMTIIPVTVLNSYNFFMTEVLWYRNRAFFSYLLATYRSVLFEE